jgi:hypothetical protein
MRHCCTTLAIAALLIGATLLAPALAARPLGPYRHAVVRPSPEWRWASRCDGRYYRYLGGWGCDYYRYPR